MNFAIWNYLGVATSVLTSLFREASPSTLREHNPIIKRTEFVLECDHARVNTVAILGVQLHTLFELCRNYPYGLGAECAGDRFVYRVPHMSPLWNLEMDNGRSAQEMCEARCRCVEIAPDIPAPQEGAGARNAECVSDEEDDHGVPSSVQNLPSQAVATEQAQCSNDRSTEPRSHYAQITRDATCSSFYGSPGFKDCMAAIQLLPDMGANPGQLHLREYLAAAAGNDAISHFPKVQTPLLRTVASCTVATLFPEGEGKDTRMVVDSLVLVYRAITLAHKCAAGLGQEGYTLASQQYYPDHRPRTQLPNVYIYGSNSDMDRWLKLKLACGSGTKGKAECEADDLKLPKDPKTESKDLGSSCSGKCMSPSDCDINSNCVCASNKGFPLSSTWGQHVCTYVIGAGTILASSAVRPANVCRGRCLLQDGTLSVSATNTSNTSNTFDVSLANLTASSLTIAVSDLVPVQSGSPAFSTANDSLASDHRSSLPSYVPSSNIVFQDHSSAVLTCPCNCTYVSAACCGSRTVWENPEKQIQMDPLPTNTSVYCNSTSGQWLPKPVGYAVSTQKDGTSGFAPIGTVRYNPSAERIDGVAPSNDRT